MKKKCDARLSVSLAYEDYQELIKLSEEKDVSIAWLVRKAVDHYLKELKKESKSK
ncbi:MULTISPECIES: ribbon-helix-helix domain-containing protein [Vibrio]|uniref:ribbon-helix-helix domain-containing protein n=1 Tax=Vibrio TaxID=662 RepID=UPI000DE1F533|nr:hypothetical protein DLR61_17250 [Vibrio tarriae]